MARADAEKRREIVPDGNLGRSPRVHPLEQPRELELQRLTRHGVDHGALSDPASRGSWRPRKRTERPPPKESGRPAVRTQRPGT
jgi:hypothetical protein